MASIWKRNGNWRAEVRRRGYPLLTSTFDTKALAEAWARRIESEMDRGAFVDRTEAERNTLGDLLIRYSKEVSPSKKGGVGEIQRIKVLCTDPLARLKAASLSGKAMAEFRDRRLNGHGTRKKVSGSTVNRELTLIGHVINVARKEWGVHVDVNPVSIIRRPKENRGRSRRLAQTEEARLLQELEPRPRHDQGYFLKGGSRNECARPIVILAIETAMRRGELLSLRWEDGRVYEDRPCGPPDLLEPEDENERREWDYQSLDEWQRPLDPFNPHPAALDRMRLMLVGNWGASRPVYPQPLTPQRASLLYVTASTTASGSDDDLESELRRLLSGG